MLVTQDSPCNYQLLQCTRIIVLSSSKGEIRHACPLLPVLFVTSNNVDVAKLFQSVSHNPWRVRAWHVYPPVRELCVPREESSVQIRITAVPFPLCSSAPTKHNAIRTLRNSESVLKEYIYLCLVCENLRASAPFPQQLRHPTQITSRLVPHVKLLLSVCGANLDEY